VLFGQPVQNRVARTSSSKLSVQNFGKPTLRDLAEDKKTTSFCQYHFLKPTEIPQFNVWWIDGSGHQKIRTDQRNTVQGKIPSGKNRSTLGIVKGNKALSVNHWKSQ
jgi:hypothetical protein